MNRFGLPVWVDDILGPLNVIDWVQGLILGIIYRDVTPHRIAIPHPEGDFWEQWQGAFFNLRDVMRLLKKYGVRYYWIGFNGREIWLHVPRRQASWADGVLILAGVPVSTPEHDPKRSRWAHRGVNMPRAWEGQAKERRQQRRRRKRPGPWARIRRNGRK